MKTLGLIPARLGSRRFPAKPLALISGKSLIQRTYENAKQCNCLDDLCVATDSEIVVKHVEKFGGQAVVTSSACSTGTERIAEAVAKHEQFSHYDAVINIQGDQPLLEPEVISQVIETVQGESDDVIATAIVELASEQEAEAASVVKCVIDLQGYALYFSRALLPAGHLKKWSTETTFYKHLGIYGFRRDFLLLFASLPATPLQQAEDLEQLKALEHGFRIKAAVVQSSSIGVDRPQDLKKVEQSL